MATQLQNYFILATPFAALWMLVFAGFIELSSGQRSFALYYLPVMAVISFGIYAAYSVIYGATNIKDCAEAKRELHAEIEEASAELKKKGIIGNDEKNK